MQQVSAIHRWVTQRPEFELQAADEQFQHRFVFSGADHERRVQWALSWVVQENNIGRRGFFAHDPGQLTSRCVLDSIPPTAGSGHTAPVADRGLQHPPPDDRFRTSAIFG